MSVFAQARAQSAFEPPEILGRAIYGIASWNLNDTCNYRCGYCTQRNMISRDGRLDDVDRWVDAFCALPGSWEVKLSGGEPFQQPGLDRLAAGLVARGHVISVQTNFSAPEKKLLSFLEATRGALHVFSASLHLDYATAAQFIERAAVLEPYRALGLRFHVTSVATRARLYQLRDEVAPALRAAGIALKVQPEKLRGEVIAYTPEERDLLTALGGHNLTGAIAPNYQGRLCHAGARYLVIKSDGQVYRCYPGSRHGGRHARLGSLADGIRLSDGPRLCPYTYCYCTVPIQRGMIAGVPRRDEEEAECS